MTAERSFILQGQLEIQIGEQTRVLAPGEFALIAPGQVHGGAIRNRRR
jgi:quercetin dioxygenase-like cupin family protein